MADTYIELQKEIERLENRERSLSDLLERTLPMLVRLGDFIGNGDIDSTRKGSLGTRCDLIGDIKQALGL